MEQINEHQRRKEEHFEIPRLLRLDLSMRILRGSKIPIGEEVH